MTESVLFSSFHLVEETWNKCVSLGIKFALDDFGTGFSNLETLVNVPFDLVKVDRRVTLNARKNYQLINLVAAMLERLEKPVVAEGVETQNQLDFIQASGVDYIQGFLFSRPIPEDQFIDLLRFDHEH